MSIKIFFIVLFVFAAVIFILFGQYQAGAKAPSPHPWKKLPGGQQYYEVCLDGVKYIHWKTYGFSVKFNWKGDVVFCGKGSIINNAK